MNWSYGTYTWHTQRDTYDKAVLDDLRNNATLTAMLTYLASEDPEKLSRDQRVFDRGSAPSAGQGGFGGQLRAWPSCTEPLRNSSLYRR